MLRRLLAACIAMGFAAPALAYDTPQRGSGLRAALMDAMRPVAEWHYGPPVQFVVHDLRVSGDVAFASVTAQRPGGRPIVLGETPGYRRGELEAEFDWNGMQALLQRSGKTWVPVHAVVSASDVWWSDPALCPTWRAVIPEFCR